ncbi:beta-1,3-galactosyltransferase 1-like [Mercenaria mercenaria]|uniref:beta-1,3-galactosyltransferase 1-like n=1 Tax=Mercenaria mercenaria TaxID=6596 RepID=UPI00234ECE92|nr:beta-1,3-galactosyltransferase 1-like [Mercenaria mercenaria]
MNSGFHCSKFKLFLLYMLVLFSVIITILSKENVRFDTFRITVTVKNHIAYFFESRMTYDASKEETKISMKSELSQNINTSTRISPLKSPLESKDFFKVKMKPDLMKLVNPSNPKFALTVNGSYLLENKNHCSSVSNLTILVMVLSAPNNFQKRITIRETWANGSLYSSYGTIKVIFLLGIIDDSKVQYNIEKEFKRYGDIVQGSFVDSYHNLSHKSVMGYKWATERCRKAKYVIKTDDDIVINMFRVFKSDIHVMSVNQNHVHCQRFTGSLVVREKQHKYYVGPNQFKGRTFYPPYCNGQYVLMLNVIVPYLYESALQTPLFWIDDVFIYGLVMGNIPALKYRQITVEEIGTYRCWEEENSNCIYRYQVTEGVTQMKDVWTAITKQNT